MNTQIYREESLQQIKSPDDMKQYIKVAPIGMWLMLGAILIFIIGGLVWGIFAKLETKVSCAVLVEGDVANCYVYEKEPVSAGMNIQIEDRRMTLGDHGEMLKKLETGNPSEEAILHVMGRNTDGWYYIYSLNGFGDMEDGVYKGEIIVDSVSPISFLINGK